MNRRSSVLEKKQTWRERSRIGACRGGGAGIPVLENAIFQCRRRPFCRTTYWMHVRSWAARSQITIMRLESCVHARALLGERITRGCPVRSKRAARVSPQSSDRYSEPRLQAQCWRSRPHRAYLPSGMEASLSACGSEGNSLHHIY